MHPPVWTTLGIEVNITMEGKVCDNLDYCHANPVRRGLLDRPEDWRWSSYRFYQEMDRALSPMDWDGDRAAS